MEKAIKFFVLRGLLAVWDLKAVGLEVYIFRQRRLFLKTRG